MSLNYTFTLPGTIFLVMAVLAATDPDRVQRWPHRRALLPPEVNGLSVSGPEGASI